VDGLTPDELLGLLARLRLAPVANIRAPHKPLLLLWLFGRFAATGSSLAAYAEAEEPVSRLINEFGPPVKSPSAARSRAAMPFVHLERELWDLRDGQGREIGPDAPERRGWLNDHEAVGRLRPEVEQLLSDGGTLAAASRLLLDRHFTPLLADLICAEVDLDLAGLTAVVPPEVGWTRRRARRPGFAEEVLRAYAYQCAMCGFDGALGRTPVGIEAAHVRWHSQDGPDDVANGLALCALHHALLDLGVLGLTADRRICVSGLYVARSDAGKAVDALAGQPLLTARPGQPAVDIAYVSWHNVQVFKGDYRHPQRKDGRPHAAAAQSAPERAISRLEAADAAASRDE
jgi:putative restriction endonuclease